VTAFIPSIWAASIGGELTSLGSASAPRPDIPLPDAAYKLVTKAGITPPAAGQYLDMADTDAKLASAGMSNADRVATKLALRNAGCLPAGKRVDQS
jgi:hypothetical protein